MPLPSSRVVHPRRADRISTIVESAMPDRATFTRATLAQTATGGQTATTKIVAANIPCRLVAHVRPPQEGITAEEIAGRQPFVLAVPTDRVEVKRRDHVTVGVHSLVVLGFFTPASFSPEQRIFCVEVA